MAHRVMGQLKVALVLLNNNMYQESQIRPDLEKNLSLQIHNSDLNWEVFLEGVQGKIYLISLFHFPNLFTCVGISESGYEGTSDPNVLSEQNVPHQKNVLF